MQSSPLKNKLVHRLFLRVVLLLLPAFAASSIQAQFSSGSTGADGAFSPVANTTLQIPASGVFNFTTVNIPQNVEVRFTKNARNTPVTILATGAVVIGGRIFVDGGHTNGRFGGAGGPGGFRGGNGGTPIDSINGTAGDGPGGGGAGIGGATGNATGGGAGFLVVGQAGILKNGDGIVGPAGPRYGTRTLLPLIGGSGGGGGSSFTGSNVIGGGGGGGGGAILIASSVSITFPDNTDSTRGIYARSGEGGPRFAAHSGGSGSGGAIRLVSNTISGSPCLNVESIPANFSIAVGSAGIIRVEAFNLSQYVPRCSTSEQTLGEPNPVTLPNTPTLVIASVGGVSAPANPAGSFNSPPDIVVPTSVPNPVQVVVNGTNLPSGTAVQVKLTPESGNPTTVAGTLTGSTSSSTATVNLILPNSGLSVIRATVTLEMLIAQSNPMFINGERVKAIEVATTFGGTSEVVYVTSSGRRVTPADLRK
ncbi:MAG TPA: hypothetical protein VFS77_15130 [Pyrinomonadaceae bacterium]|nr:hypothetical protein [Pyrinomonadaceae bacterium]